MIRVFNSIFVCQKKMLYISVLLMLISMPVQAEYRIGLAVWSGYPDSVKGFKAGLATHNIKEGNNLTLIHGKESSDKSIQADVAQQFIDEKVDLVYSLTTPGTAIMKSLLPEDTPIVFSIVTFPADSGLIESFDYSGNNLTGTSNYISMRHFIHMMDMITPDIKHAAIFHRKGEPNSKIQSANFIRQLRRKGIAVTDLEPENLEELIQMAEDVVSRADLFITTTDTLLQSGGEEALIRISLKYKVPVLSSNKTGITQGALYGPVADFYTLGYMAGEKAADILKNGTPPSRISSEWQDPPLFLINRASLQHLGINLPEAVLDKVHFVD